MHNLTTAVMIDTPVELAAISNSIWPNLGIVVIKQQMTDSEAGATLAQCKLQVLAFFDLLSVEHVYAALILKPSTDQQRLDLAFQRQLESLSRVMHASRPRGTYSPWNLGMYKFA